MKGTEYFFSPDGKTFLPLGGSASDKSGKNRAEKLVNSKKRKFPVLLAGGRIFLAKRIMPEKNKEKISPGRIQFLVAPLTITRNKKKIVLAIGGEFCSQDGHTK